MTPMTKQRRRRCKSSARHVYFTNAIFFFLSPHDGVYWFAVHNGQLVLSCAGCAIPNVDRLFAMYALATKLVVNSKLETQ